MSIGRLQSDPGSPAKRKLEAFLQRGGAAAHGLTISDAWTVSNGTLTHTKVRQRVLGITVDQSPAAIGVTVEQRTKYNYDPRRDTLHIEASDWQVDSNAAAECAADMCTLMQKELRIELSPEGPQRDNHDRTLPVAAEAEILVAIRNWTGEPFTSLLAGHVDPEGIASFISQTRQLCEVCMCEWLKSHNDQGGIE